MPRPIHIGISTCPNDTFAFAGILTRSITSSRLNVDVDLLDIEQLNVRLAAGHFDIAKTSFAAATRLPKRIILPVGSALGYGVGPLLLAADADTRPSTSTQRTLCPGKGTTASMLFDLFHPQTTRIEHAVFSEIMPALQRREADFGVCIHEGRFTWADQGLHLVEDLGDRWEQRYRCPLPLGGLVASDDLSSDVIGDVVDLIRRSLQWALDQPSLALPTMRRHAQSMDDDVLMGHVDLYVNQWTVDLGETGRDALQRLFGLADAQPRFAMPHAA